MQIKFRKIAGLLERFIWDLFDNFSSFSRNKEKSESSLKSYKKFLKDFKEPNIDTKALKNRYDMGNSISVGAFYSIPIFYPIILLFLVLIRVEVNIFIFFTSIMFVLLSIPGIMVCRNTFAYLDYIKFRKIEGTEKAKNFKINRNAEMKSYDLIIALAVFFPYYFLFNSAIVN